MRRLIINADDFGINAPRSHGILIAFEQGIVRSATMHANGSDSDAAARRARERKLPCGLHFNMSEGTPVSPPDSIGSLIDANGWFRDTQQQRRLLNEGEIDPQHIEREARAQIEWMLDAYGQPTHLAGNYDIHVHPTVARVLDPLIERYGIRFVRLPKEPVDPFGWDIPESQKKEIAETSAESQAAKPIFESLGIGSADHFRGLALLGHASKKNLRHILAKLPEGLTELMVHPGSLCAAGTAFDMDPQRQTELQMLTDEGLPALLAEKKITLCSYAEL